MIRLAEKGFFLLGGHKVDFIAPCGEKNRVRINVFPVSHAIFFLLECQKIDFLQRTGK